MSWWWNDSKEMDGPEEQQIDHHEPEHDQMTFPGKQGKPISKYY